MSRKPIRQIDADAPHNPVLLSEVVEAVGPRDRDLIVDGTFGAGGYTRALLNAAPCRVIAFDRDVSAHPAAQAMAAEYGDRFRFAPAPFGDMETVVRALETSSDDAAPPADGPLLDAVVLDIGVSSMQIDQPERGFSFQTDGPLDMRMTQSGPWAGPSAADIVNSADDETLADILFHLGDERRSRAIARAILKARAEKPITRTLELAAIVARALGTPKIDGRHSATRSFQALRIYVNDELGQLAEALIAAERLLKPGGRLAVVTFHSLEDRLVKAFLRTRTGRESKGSRHAPQTANDGPAPSFRFETNKAIAPSDAEVARNPRARSARLRWAVRTDAPAWLQSASDLDFPRLPAK